MNKKEITIKLGDKVRIDKNTGQVIKIKKYPMTGTLVTCLFWNERKRLPRRFFAWNEKESLWEYKKENK